MTPQVCSRSRSSVSSGTSRRRNDATVSPGALRRMEMMTARSSIVSGRVTPLLARMAMQNVGKSSVTHRAAL